KFRQGQRPQVARCPSCRQRLLCIGLGSITVALVVGHPTELAEGVAHGYRVIHLACKRKACSKPLHSELTVTLPPRKLTSMTQRPRQRRQRHGAALVSLRRCHPLSLKRGFQPGSAIVKVTSNGPEVAQRRHHPQFRHLATGAAVAPLQRGVQVVEL